MKSVTAMTVVQKRWRWCLPGLLCGALLACGGSGSDPAPIRPTALAATMKVSKTMTYSVLALGAGEITQIAVINAATRSPIPCSARGGIVIRRQP